MGLWKGLQVCKYLIIIYSYYAELVKKRRKQYKLQQSLGKKVEFEVTKWSLSPLKKFLDFLREIKLQFLSKFTLYSKIILKEK